VKKTILPLLFCLLISVSLLAEEKTLREKNEEATVVQAQLKPELDGTEITERLGQMINKDLIFKNHNGEEVTVGDYFDGTKPIVLQVAYATCDQLCTLVLNGGVEALAALNLQPGEDYQILTFSIDHEENTATAYSRRKNYIELFKTRDTIHGPRQIDESAWVFHTGSKEDNRLLADSVGFGYRYDETAVTNQYLHQAVTIILSPEGKITRYHYGVIYSPSDMKLSLIEAGQGKVGTTVERILLWCYSYDPKLGGYTPSVLKLMMAGGVLTLIGVFSVMFVLWRKELRMVKVAQ
jgi:protein SCO1/2